MPGTSELKEGRSVVIGGTVSLVSSVGGAPDLQAGGSRFRVLYHAHFLALNLL